MSPEILKNIKLLQLPPRFEHKLHADIDFLLSYNIPTLESIILFGSCARKNLRVTSDIDLLIITIDSIERSIRGEISSILEDDIDLVRTDCIFYTQEQFQDSTRIFTQQIKTEGIILYSR